MERRRCPCDVTRLGRALRAGEGFDETTSAGVETGSAALTLELCTRVTPPGGTVVPRAWTVTPAGLGAAGARVAPRASEVGCVSTGVVMAWSFEEAGRRELAAIHPMRNARAIAAAATVVCIQQRLRFQRFHVETRPKQKSTLGLARFFFKG